LPGDTQGAALAGAGDAGDASIGGRRVRLPGEGQQEPSLYAQVRKWVQNDPDLITPPEVFTVPALPPLQRGAAPPGAPPPVAPPLASSDALSLPGTDELRESHLTHWRAVGRQVRQQAAQSREPFVERLQAALAPAREAQ
jgi:hypothetical protein